MFRFVLCPVLGVLALLLSVPAPAQPPPPSDRAWWDGQWVQMLPPGPTRLETLKAKLLRERAAEPGCWVRGDWLFRDGRFWLIGFRSCRGPMDLMTVFGWPISPDNSPLRADWLHALVHTHRGKLLCGSGQPGSHSLWAEHWVIRLDHGRALEHRRFDRRADPRVPPGPGPHAQCLGQPDAGLSLRDPMLIGVEPPSRP